jgi:RNA polymerase sigma-70 factor (ECF subfamily)
LLSILEPDWERLLIESAQRDLNAFQELYHHYFPRVYAYVNYRVTNVQDAEDLVTDIFIKVAGKLGRFQWQGDGSFAAWLFRIAHDLVIDFYRKNSHVREPLSLNDLPDIKCNMLLPDEVISQKEKFVLIRKIIDKLSPRRQEIIVLKFYGGLRNHEIAKVLGLGERTVASHLCRGLEDLQTFYLQQYVHSDKEEVHERK